MCKHIFLSALVIFTVFSCANKGTGNFSMAASDTINVNAENISDDASMYLIVGTYTSGESDGIYVYQLDTITGTSKYISTVGVTNPSYLTISNDEKFVYAVTETGDNTAAANAFSFDKEKGELKLLNTQLTGGADPCYINVDKEGKHVVTANYSGGGVTLFDVKEDGTLSTASKVFKFTGKGANADRQANPHIHCVQYSPDQKYLFATDLGTDKIHKFETNANSTENYLKMGTPPFTKVADASGPRHLEFHPNGKYAYLINEISGTVIGFNYDSQNGNLSEFQTILADTLNAQGSGDIHITPDGKYLYASNRLKEDGLAIFSIDQLDGKLTKVGYQKTGVHPRNFIITPNGKYLLVASRDDNMIQIYIIDSNTGLLENIYKDIELDMPVCLKLASFN